VAAELREAGVSLQLLRKVVDYLRAREGLSATEVLARTNLVTNGEAVYEESGDVTLHLPSGQRVMMVHVTIPLDQVVREVQRKARVLRRAA
jgi:phosphoribosyl-ATP pyrophosphohydrolase